LEELHLTVEKKAKEADLPDAVDNSVIELLLLFMLKGAYANE
jgi:hypothetical protein